MAVHAATQQLADLISDKFLKAGAGNLNPTLDQLARAWQDDSGMTLADSLAFVDPRTGRLDRAIPLLEQDGWGVWVPYTSTFKTLGFVEPDDTDWQQLLSCVAGQGRASLTVGIHFHVPHDTNCWMWMVWRDFFDKVGNGAKQVSRENLELVRDDDLQPTALTDSMTARRLAVARGETKELRALAAPKE